MHANLHCMKCEISLFMYQDFYYDGEARVEED